jgi:hypothetical protein
MLRPVLLILFLAFSITSCDVVKQAQKAGNLLNCSFRLKSVENLSLAGVNIQQVTKLTDLSVSNVAMLTSAAMGGSLPLQFNLNLEGKNPNQSAAGLAGFDYILLIDNIEMTKGVINRKVNIPAGKSSIIPMQMNIDLKKALSGKGTDALLNFVMNLAGSGSKPTRFSMKIKPTIKIGDYPLQYPDYLTIGTEFK